MTAPELKNIEVGNELDETTELKEIAKLKDLSIFEKTTDAENMTALKTLLKETNMTVITSAKDADKKTKEEKTLLQVATEFDKYVEQGEGWKLKLKEKDAAGTDLLAPEWIKYIIENPQNNDLAYFIQQLAGLIEYQTAKAYTATELTAVEVGVDKAFGNQTKRALAGLKNWIESDATSVEKTTFLKKSTITDLITTNTKSGTIDTATLNTALAAYHLIFDDDKWVKPATGYEFIDPNSTNYATQKEGTIKKTDVVNDASAKILVKSIELLPTGFASNPIRSGLPENYIVETEGTNDYSKFVFFRNGRVKMVKADGKSFDMGNSIDISKKLAVTEITKTKATTATTEVKNESTNKIGEKIFDNYEDQIKEYVATVSGIQLQTAISENPYLYIAESDTWNTIEKINVNTYIKDGALDMVTLKKQIDFLKKRTDNLKTTITTLRGKTYTATDLFGTDKKFQTDAYKTFFKYFENDTLLIDKSEMYTFYQVTSGTAIHYSTIQFDLDQSGAWDHAYCKGLTIDVVNDKVVNKDGTLNEAELKKFLAKKITTIVENPENGYA